MESQEQAWKYLQCYNEWNFFSFVMMGIIMVYLHIITVNALSLLFHIYNNESIENKQIFFTFNFTVRTLIWHLTVYSLRP